MTVDRAILLVLVAIQLPALWRWIRSRLASETKVQQALVHAFGEVGLPVEAATNPAFNLSRTGKLNDVIHHASKYLGVTHPLATVGDVRTFLARR